MSLRCLLESVFGVCSANGVQITPESAENKTLSHSYFFCHIFLLVLLLLLLFLSVLYTHLLHLPFGHMPGTFFQYTSIAVNEREVEKVDKLNIATQVAVAGAAAKQAVKVKFLPLPLTNVATHFSQPQPARNGHIGAMVLPN